MTVFSPVVYVKCLYPQMLANVVYYQYINRSIFSMFYTKIDINFCVVVQKPAWGWEFIGDKIEKLYLSLL